VFFFSLYRFFVLFLSPLSLLLCFFVSSTKEKWRESFFYKLGFLKESFKKKIEEAKKLDKKIIWVHAVSFGEVKTLEGLFREIEKLKTKKGVELVLSTCTKAGFKLANKRLPNQAFYFPYDHYFLVRKLLDFIRPDLILITESEFWPEFIVQSSHEKKIPVFLINARLSNNSYKFWSFFASFGSFVFSKLEIFAQTRESEKRFRFFKPKELYLTGNLKLESSISSKISEDKSEKIREKIIDKLRIDQNTKIIIAGSTHFKEEEIILKAFPKNKNSLLILAPRHLERVPQIQNLCKKLRFRYQLKSSLDNRNYPGFQESKSNVNTVLILDTMGDLSSFYGICDLALLGGTWIPLGGHNPLEAGVYGVKVITGRHIFKIQELFNLLKEFGLISQAQDIESLSVLIKTELANKNQKKKKIKILKKLSEQANTAQKIMKRIQIYI